MSGTRTAKRGEGWRKVTNNNQPTIDGRSAAGWRTIIPHVKAADKDLGWEDWGGALAFEVQQQEEQRRRSLTHWFLVYIERHPLGVLWDVVPAHSLDPKRLIRLNI